MRRAFLASTLLALSLLSGCLATVKATQLVLTNTERTIRERKGSEPRHSPYHAPILLLAFDGVGRDLLYEMLRADQLPELTDLLSGEGKNFPHAHFDETLLSTMPSSTMAGWTTTLTGLPPAEHGVTGNEYFIREDRKLAAPAPVSFNDPEPTIEIYTEGYLNSLVKVPTVYQKMREREPHILIWVALHQLYSGADRLLFATSTVMAHALEEGIVKTTKTLAKTATLQENPPDRSMFQMLDEDVVKKVESALDDDGPVPDVLTVYLSGTDLYAHVAEEGPDRAQRAYLRDVADPAIRVLKEALRARDALRGRWVVVTSDHGHTPVRNDRKHALWTDGDDSPPGLMRKVGYRLRPFRMEVEADASFDAVLAEGGATAYIYLADRSTCANGLKPCDWTKPPRYEEDVLPLAEALHRNNQDGSLAPRLKGTLDLILTRKPRPFSDKDAPFEVYVGDTKTMTVRAYLAQHPHPTYVEVEARLEDLAVGRHGERAGDIMLLAHNGDRDIPDERYYFASPYRSWHGSPSRQDSEIPFIVASPKFEAQQIRARVAALLGPAPRQQKVAEVLLDLRSDKR